MAITYGALHDKLVARGHNVTVVSPRLNNCDHGETNLYAGQPVILCTWSNITMFKRLFEANDVVVTPDETQVPLFCFLAHWTNTPLLLNMHTCAFFICGMAAALLAPARANPAKRSNFRMVLEGGSLAARWLAAPIMDTCLWIFSYLAPLTYTTSPSYRDVLVKRTFRVCGVFSPRIKLAVFEKPPRSHDDVVAARKWLIGNEVPFKPKTLLIFAGRWSHEKRINLLTEAVPRDCVLAIVGDGPRSQAVNIARLHDPERGIVVHPGMVDQERLAVLYRASDFLVSASAFETLGMTVAEAHLCGTPVIVQAAPGFTTQVIEGENGFLIDFAAPDAVDKVMACIEAKPSRARVLQTTKKRWDEGMPNLEDVVEKLAETTRDDWTCVKVPLPIYLVLEVAYTLLYLVSSWPFVIFKGYNINKKVDARTRDKKLR